MGPNFRYSILKWLVFAVWYLGPQLGWREWLELAGMADLSYRSGASVMAVDWFLQVFLRVASPGG